MTTKTEVSLMLDKLNTFLSPNKVLLGFGAANQVGKEVRGLHGKKALIVTDTERRRKMRLKDKVAIITGAGSGSGRAGSIVFAREGARVVVGDIAVQAGEETVKMIKEAGGEAIFVQIDAGKVEDMRRLINMTMDAYAKIDILWNHAGIPGPGPIEETDEIEFDKTMNVNSRGAFFATQFAIPFMKKARKGSIIFTSSTSAVRGSPWSPFYSMSKGGLISLTMSLAVYLGPFNIRTNCICPCIIDSPMGRVFVDRSGKLDAESLIKAYGERVPMGRPCLPEDVAYAALFLASDEASFINGVILPVDGGLIVKS